MTDPVVRSTAEIPFRTAALLGTPLTHFAHWHHLRGIRRLPSHNTAAAVRSAKQEITVAAAFLEHLSDQGVDLESVSQRHIDGWLAPGPTTRYHARTFVVWAMRHKHLPRAVEFPRRRARTQPAMDDEKRLELIRRCLDDDHVTLNTRVAAILLLVYAQPLVRIAALRCDDVVVDPETGGTFINLGEPPAPVPEPFASVLHQQRNDRLNPNTGTTDSPWLFPSTRAGQHICANTILHKLRDLGIDPESGTRRRAAAPGHPNPASRRGHHARIQLPSDRTARRSGRRQLRQIRDADQRITPPPFDRQAKTGRKKTGGHQ